jgi:hypothetical protein
MLKKYASIDMETGEPQKNKEGTKYIILPEKAENFDKEFNKLLDEKVELNSTFPFELAKEMKMSIAELTIIKEL